MLPFPHALPHRGLLQWEQVYPHGIVSTLTGTLRYGGLRHAGKHLERHRAHRHQPRLVGEGSHCGCQARIPKPA
jgi:hypothetical protein